MKDLLRERRALTPAAQTPFLAPIPQPRIVFSTSRSYRSHDEEMMRAGEAWHDADTMRRREGEIAVKRYRPPTPKPP